MNSLAARVGLAGALVVAIFASLTAFGLERAFRESAEAAVAERLQAQLYLLMGATEVEENGQPRLPEGLPEPRLELPGSGLYAEILDSEGQRLWRSPSALGRRLPAWPEEGLARATGPEDAGPQAAAEFLIAALPVEWEVGERVIDLRFRIADDLRGYAAELGSYRRALWGWLAAMAAVLLVVQAYALRWGLRPLREVATELNEIESGARPSIEGRYPQELQRLTDGLNALLRHERAQQARYRDALGDLAHSLKTPLAVLRGSLDTDGNSDAVEQLQRIDRIVGYQLQRASTSGRSVLAVPQGVGEAARRVGASLDKVYADKGVRLEIEVGEEALFRGNEGDLFELLGNLLDNAYKWSAGRVRLDARLEHGRLLMAVDDDGPGIDPAQLPLILARGGRLDENRPGQGIGLAVVKDIVEAYDGTFAIERSELGGARVMLRLPA
jgi:two-component system sensor histidine kinase PhoQ